MMSKPVEIENPVHGAILSARQGTTAPEGLLIDVYGHALTSGPVLINGNEAVRDGDNFSAKVLLTGKQNDVVAVSDNHRDVARVLWDMNSKPRWAIGIDDCSFFLEDICRNGYESLFNSPFVLQLKKLHEKYDAKFTLNLFYEVHPNHHERIGRFSLDQFPDRYRGEWIENSDWLRLAFHAFSEWPNAPYLEATNEQLAKDFDMIKRQIIRFAGEETYTPTSVVHWGIVRPETFPVLAERGVKFLAGYFRPKEDGSYEVHYLLDDERCKYLWEHEALKDFKSGIVFGRIDLVVNEYHVNPGEEVQHELDALLKNPNLSEVVVFLDHEQYSDPRYWCDGKVLGDPNARKDRYAFQPFYFESLERATRVVHEKGYKPVFLNECYKDL